MLPNKSIVESFPSAKQVVRGNVLAILKDRVVIIVYEDERSEKVNCDVLRNSHGLGLCLLPGDMVLVWLPESDEERGVVLGRIGPSRAPAVEPEKTQETPDELVIEAKKNLTLKCGDGSITLRKDGKILIKGKDLVSRAKRMNRIKGGSVTIN